MTSYSLPTPRELDAMAVRIMYEDAQNYEPASSQEEDEDDYEDDEDNDDEDLFDDFHLTFKDADIGGDCYLTRKDPDPVSVTVFPTDFPAQDKDKVGIRIEVSHRQMDDFIYVNAEYLVELGYTIDDAIKIGYFRLLAAGNGLTSPDFEHETFFLTENHSRRLSKVETSRRIFSSQDLGIRDIIRDVLNAEVRRKVCTHFTDIVCCVAYMFRVRGHRYRPEYLPRYEALWKKCSKKSSDLVLSWRHLAIESLYAMFPFILDRYWINSSIKDTCDYALSERIDVPPAGFADMAALDQGMADIKILLPGIFNHFTARYEKFHRKYAAICETRWRGSINCHLYGEKPVKFSSSSLAPLAAAVVGVFDEISPDYPLLCCRAIHRLAERAALVRDGVTWAIREAAANKVQLRPRAATI